jgi:hypothetical protein
VDNLLIPTTTEEPVQGLAIPVDQPSYHITPETATARAQRLSYAMPDLKPFEDMYAQLASGQEQGLRREVADKVNLQAVTAKNEMIKTVAQGYAKSGKPIPQELFYKLNESTSLDPTHAFEAVYGKAYVDNLRNTRTDPSSVLSSADKVAPEQVTAFTSGAEKIVAYTNYLQNKREDVSDILQKQSVGGWLLDQAKMISQVYQEWKFRGHAGTSFFTELGLGTSLNEQSVRLYQMPFPQFQKTVDGIITYLAKDNPSAALFYINAIIDQSAGEKFLNNTMSALTLTAVGTAARALKGGREIVQAHKATKDFLKAATIPEPTNVRIAEGLGDATKAAEAKIFNNILDEIGKTKDPVKEATDAMSPLFKAQETAFIENPGKHLGQEIVNRIGERMNLWSGKVMETVTNIMNVERLPFLKAGGRYAEDVIKGYEAELRAGGLKDSWISSQVRWNPVSKTYFVDHVIGMPDGTLWKGVDGAKQAEIFATQHGLRTVKESPTVFHTGVPTIEGSKGSRYTVTADGKTVRQLSPTEFAYEKAAVASELKRNPKSKLVAQDIRPESGKTAFVSLEDAAKITQATSVKSKGKLVEGKGFRIVDNGAELLVVKQGPKQSDIVERVPYTTTPEVGKNPVELFAYSEKTGS